MTHIAPSPLNAPSYEEIMRYVCLQAKTSTGKVSADHIQHLTKISSNLTQMGYLGVCGIVGHSILESVPQKASSDEA